MDIPPGSSLHPRRANSNSRRHNTTESSPDSSESSYFNFKKSPLAMKITDVEQAKKFLKVRLKKVFVG